MKKYDEYKDSGVEWIGEVPKHWEVIPLKFTGAFGNGLTYSPKDVVDNGILVLRSSNIQNSSLSFEDNVYVSKVSRDLLVNKGDVIICSRNGSAALVGKSAFVDKELNATFGAFMMRYIPNIDKKYGFYLFQTAIGQYKGYFSTTTINQLTKTTIGEIKIPLAMAEEQTAIATYLDTHCAKIDNLISIQQKRIALLQELKQSVITHAVTNGLNPNVEMKQSGVEWIGDVPKHWEVTKMNNNCSTITDYVASGSFADLRKNVLYLDEPDYAMLIRTADLSSNDRKLPPVYISKCSYEFLSNSNLFGGEVVLPNIGASIGNVYMVPKLYKHMSLAPNAIMVKSYGNDRFLYYYFKSKPGVDSLMLIGMAAAQDKFNKTELRSLKVLVPPLGEQAAIASYLDHKCATIDTSISNAQHQIELLQEYKQSLITEVVTGKRKVTDN